MAPQLRRSLVAFWFPLVALLAGLASRVIAGVPSCANDTYPTFIDLVGCATDGVSADVTGTFTVTIRDIGNFGVPGATVTVQLKSDVYTTSQDCCFRAITDANGVATFRVTGAGRNDTGVASWTGASAARIYDTFHGGSCNSTGWCTTAHVCTYDENGAVSARGVEISDLAAWAADYRVRDTGYRPRSDFSHNSVVDIVDVAWWGRVFSARSSVSGCGGTLYVNPNW
jgi:hypothetical protein